MAPRQNQRVEEAPEPGPIAPLAPGLDDVDRRRGSLAERLNEATIMIVDDEPIMVEVLRTFLEEDGYRNFVTTEHSVEALGLIEHERPDVLLLDLKMPEVSGFEILRAVRADPKTRHLPVLILTATADPDTKLRALELGATDFLAKPVDPSEIALRLRNALAAKAYSDHLASHDQSTGLANRRAFDAIVRRAIEEARREGGKLGIIHAGLDQLREVNEWLGPDSGDAVLFEVARRLEQCLVASGEDSGPSPSPIALARVAGDEFAMLVTGFDEVEALASAARVAMDAIAAPLPIDGREVTLSASLGIAAFPSDADNAAELVMRAASTVRAVKSAGGGAFRFFAREIEARSNARLKLESELKAGIKRGELALVFQPRLELPTGQVIELEALVRWNHPERGLLDAGQFMPAARSVGLDTAIDDWVLEQACRSVRELATTHGVSPRIGVNVYPQRFLAPDLLARVAVALERNGVEPDRLRIEVAEAVVMRDVDRAMATLEALRQMGVHLSIDHFGTGHFSLGAIKRLPVDELKIDRSFFGDESEEDAAIVTAFISMAHALGRRVTAEGVETRAQLALLRQRGCDEAQGFVLGGLLSAGELAVQMNLGFPDVRA